VSGLPGLRRPAETEGRDRLQTRPEPALKAVPYVGDLIAGARAGVELPAPVAAKPIVRPVVSTHRFEKLDDNGGPAFGAVGQLDSFAGIPTGVDGIVRVVGSRIHICTNDPPRGNEHSAVSNNQQALRKADGCRERLQDTAQIELRKAFVEDDEISTLQERACHVHTAAFPVRGATRFRRQPERDQPACDR
jgi:hypothetical protein